MLYITLQWLPVSVRAACPSYTKYDIASVPRRRCLQPSRRDRFPFQTRGLLFASFSLLVSTVWLTKGIPGARTSYLTCQVGSVTSRESPPPNQSTHHSFSTNIHYDPVRTALPADVSTSFILSPAFNAVSVCNTSLLDSNANASNLNPLTSPSSCIAALRL